MAARALASIALPLCLNLLLFTLVSSTYCPPTVPTTKPKGGGHKTKTTACPRDTLKLGVCADLLNLVNVILGTPPKSPCCSLVGDLADLEAAVCLCTAIKANVLGNNLNVPVSLELLLNYCGRKVPHGFKCA